MKTFLFFLLTLYLFPSFSLAASQKAPEKPIHIPEFPIYVEANKKSKIIKKVPINTPLIAIFKQKDWVKVADRSNGDVGWLSKNDYQKALETWQKSRTQTLWFNTQQKPNEKIAIVAYKNGKELSEKEARTLYQQIKKRQEAQERAINQWFHSMNAFFNRMQYEMQFGPAWFEPFPVIQPIVIVEKTAQAEEEKNATSKEKKK
jgi:hypothetical protein